jgi:hypothetical protein
MASHAVRDLAQLLQTLKPVLNPGVQVFARLPLQADLRGLAPLATFREAEGLTVVVDEAAAAQAGLPVLFRAAWLTLSVHSDLNAVGLTAAVASALAEAGISCNVLAAACHDHLFVPVEDGQRALACLQALQHRSAAAVTAS